MNKTNSYTPGPWRQNGSQITAQGAMQTLVAVCLCAEDAIKREGVAAKTFAERDANARLISAAPETLAALKKTLFVLESILYLSGSALPSASIEELKKYADFARAAITKAETL